jgi:hypothetical protein
MDEHETLQRRLANAAYVERINGTTSSRMSELVRMTVTTTNTVTNTNTNLIGTGVISPCTVEHDWETGCFFNERFRNRRDVPIYDQDDTNKASLLRCNGEVECERDREIKRLNTPGMVTLFCEHSICSGFQLLTECESVRHIFQMFYHRFVEPPGIIHYDRGGVN